jgi:Alcohol dehydrogenase GroES-like domain
VGNTNEREIEVNGAYKAVEVSKPGVLRVVERPISKPAAGQVRLRVEACGVCHSDLATVQGDYPGLKLPRVPGHEVVGRIEEIGPNASKWTLGQRVGVGFLGGQDNECEPCLRGDFAKWPEEELDGLSLIYFGFPVANSLPLATIGNRAFYFLGCAHGACHYVRKLNTEEWKNLSSSLSPDKDFLLKYNLSSENIAPFGFSGCGVWVGSEDPKSLIWGSEPLLVGTIHSHLEKSSLLVATKIGRILAIAKHTANFVKDSGAV